ncbi:TetR/AcrR family transcriptional regulator [Sphingomonas pruni]|uniref:TetR/AcrR family transcriptional regulator n=1 Tax=Sphingomonas pruni TaxID=40683 RepID=UPI000829BD9F|nr:TetR/AcrR family transcriptional regulator [Sphingomonas pruni]
MLGAATERFRTRGYAGTSLDDLVDATGLQRPSLYAAFGDKRALYLASLDRTIDRAGRALDQLIEADLPLEQSLKVMFRAVIDGFLTGETGPSGCIMVSTSATSAVDDAEIRARLAAFVELEDGKIEQLLAARGDPRAAAHARVATSVIHSLSVRARAGATREELETLAADCVALISR